MKYLCEEKGYKYFSERMFYRIAVLKGIENSLENIHSTLFLQSFTNYLRQTLVLMWNKALLEKFNFCFSGFSFSFRELDWALSSNSMEFWDFTDIS